MASARCARAPTQDAALGDRPPRWVTDRMAPAVLLFFQTKKIYGKN
jgi:hypothetical protein